MKLYTECTPTQQSAIQVLYTIAQAMPNHNQTPEQELGYENAWNEMITTFDGDKTEASWAYTDYSIRQMSVRVLQEVQKPIDKK